MSSPGGFPDFNGPSAPPPPGVIPNLIDPPNRNDIVTAIIAVCIILSSGLFFIRAYAKYLQRSINVSDYLTLIAFPLYWIYIYYSYRGTSSPGFLVHQWNVALKDIPKFSYVAFVASLLYLVLIAIIKCAILLDWSSIFSSHSNRIFAWTCYVTCFLFASFSTILFVLDFINCTPVQKNWNPLIPGTCRWDVPKPIVASAAVNFGLDLLPLILAQKIIWNLHTTWQKRLGVSLIFLIGIIAIITSILRLYYANEFLKHSTDATYYFYIVGLCTLCETTCAMLVLCLPFLPKAANGIKQSKAYMRISQYMTSRGTTNAESKNSGGSSAAATEERDRFKANAKPKEQWIRMKERRSGGTEEDDGWMLRQGSGEAV